MALLLLDTNVIADLLAENKAARQWLIKCRAQGDRVGLCQPINYEVLRGLVWRNATGKLNIFVKQITPLLESVAMEDDDWTQAARYWAAARSAGRQIGDADLFLAAIATRLNAVIISADQDLDALPVTRIDWRTAK